MIYREIRQYIVGFSDGTILPFTASNVFDAKRAAIKAFPWRTIIWAK